MSQENVEYVRRVYALLDEGDEAVWELASPEFVLDFSRRLIDPLVLRGREPTTLGVFSNRGFLAGEVGK